MPVANPFTPMFGIVPPYMAGRKRLISELFSAFSNGYGDPNLSSIVVGARGTGKTALISYVSDHASQCGWVVASSTASEGMLDDLIDQTLISAKEFIVPDEKRKLKSLSLGQLVGVEWDNQPVRKGTWRTQMSVLLDQLAEHDVGLLITVDEVKADLAEMRQLVIAYQHFIRERRQVALLMAGLPHNVSGLLADEDVSFIRRARQHRLGRISDNEVREAFYATVEQGGRTIAPRALDEAIAAIDGFPYMFQLVGYHVWSENPSSSEISIEDTRWGVDRARAEMESSILQSTYRELSNGDLRFLRAMLDDEGDSSLSDIAERMGVKSNYASQYKRRLIEQGVIGERDRGYVGFDMPLFREYLAGRS